MRDDWEPEILTGEEAVEQLRSVWREYRAGEAPIEEVVIEDGTSGSYPANWEDGTITVAEEMEAQREYGSFENQIMPQMESAFESAIQSEVENQREVLRRRFDFVDNSNSLNNFDLVYKGVQVADKGEGGGAHHGGRVRKFLDSFTLTDSPDHDFIVLDYSYMPWIDPLKGVVKGRAERVTRHETVHALQKAVNEDFSDLWSRTGKYDIERASTEGLANYEQYKGTNIERRRQEIVENPEEIPEFWREEVVDENLEPSNPYAYGEFAAYFLEEAFRNQISNQINQDSNLALDEIDNKLLDDFAEKRVRKTLLNEIWKQDLDGVLGDASEFVGFPFFGNMVEEEYQKMSAYMDGIDQYERKLAGPNGEPSAAQIWRNEDAVDKSMEVMATRLNRSEDYDINDYLRGEARLMAAERLDQEPDSYNQLQAALEPAV